MFFSFFLRLFFYGCIAVVFLFILINIPYARVSIYPIKEPFIGKISVKAISSDEQRLYNLSIIPLYSGDELESEEFEKVASRGYVKRSDLYELMYRAIESEKQNKRLFALESVSFTIKNARSEENSNVALFDVAFSAIIAPQLNTESLRDQLVNQKIKNARELLSRFDGIQNSEIRIWPRFLTTLPLLKWRIGIEAR